MHKYKLSAGFACGVLIDDSSMVQLDKQDALERKALQQQRLQEAATSKHCYHLKDRNLPKAVWKIWNRHMFKICQEADLWGSDSTASVMLQQTFTVHSPAPIS